MINYLDSKTQSLAQAVIDETGASQKAVCNAIISIAAITGLAYIAILFSEDGGVTSSNFMEMLSALSMPICMIIISMRLPFPLIDILRALRVAILILAAMVAIEIDNASDSIRSINCIAYAAFIYFACCDKPKPKKKTKPVEKLV